MTQIARVYVGVQPRAAGDRVVKLDAAAAHRLATVRHARRGDRVVLFDGAGWQVGAHVERVERAGILVERDEEWHPGVSVDRAEVTWIQAVPKGDKLEDIVRAATELGVSTVVPVQTERSVPTRGPSLARGTRLRAVAIAAAEQCGRADVPTIAPFALLHEALASLPERVATRLVLWERADRPVSQALRAAPPGAVAVLSGPEGGFEAAEVELAGRHGFVAVSLGARILRAETVAPAVLGIIAALHGDLVT